MTHKSSPRSEIVEALAMLLVVGVVPVGDGARGEDAGRLAAKGEMLYNGIELPRPWPPHGRNSLPRDPQLPPYLASPPKVIPIHVGRQLFVDDFLIENTTLQRTYHRAEYYQHNPVLRPDKPWEITPPNPCAMVFSDGVFYDPQDELFKMWYMAGYVAGTGYATSKDGIRWQKPVLDVFPGTNLVQKGRRDSSTVWLDHTAKDRQQRFKMGYWVDGVMKLCTSPDGIHWSEPVSSGKVGDRTTFFYNPFRGCWVHSLRAGIPGDARVRRYWKTKDFLDAQWKLDEVPLWVGSDNLDPRREDIKTQPQLYNLDCVAYESLLLGLFSIWRGQPRDRAKPNEVCLGFSRDGFHWFRPDRRAFLPVSEQPGDWNWANVQSAGGGCLIVGDQLYFYVSGRAGIRGSTASGVCVTSLGILRRDGFASLDAGPEPAQVTTRPVKFRGKYLFVNADTARGMLRAEILDERGQPLQPFTRENCEPLRADGTRLPVRWRVASTDLGTLAGRPVRFRFELSNGSLYAFWVSPQAGGASHGYVAAGGPGFRGPLDHGGEN